MPVDLALDRIESLALSNPLGSWVSRTTSSFNEIMVPGVQKNAESECMLAIFDGGDPPSLRKYPHALIRV